jgi:hypothetical protein
METSEHIGVLIEALAKADLANPGRTATAKIPTKSGGSFSYTYAKLEDILTLVRPLLAKVDIVVMQEASTVDNRTSVTTRLAHTNGQWLQFGPMGIPHAGDAQALGSAITYGRRYQLLAALGLAADDDDGASSTTERDSWDTAVKAPPAAAVRDEGPLPTPAAGAVASAGSGEVPVGPGKTNDTEPQPADAPTFDALRKLVGSASATRELVNTANGTEYTARTIVDVTPFELKLAHAEWQEQQDKVTA